MNITRKKSLLYAEIDDEKREDYGCKLKKIISKNGEQSLVYIDESGFEAHGYRPYADAHKGQKIIGQRSGKWRARTNLILGRQKGQLIAPMLFKSTINTECVNQWVTSCLLQELQPNSTFILDNARFHKKTDLEKILHEKKIV